MKAISSITIDRRPDELVISIDPIGEGIVPGASILNYSGELIEKLEVKNGINRLALKAYSSKNYSIRITNGKNVITQKI